jgi:hypothetical protein
MSSEQQRPQTAQPKKKGRLQFDFSTTEDLFISTKGRVLRNLYKKLDQIAEIEKGTRKGDVQPTDAQKEKVAQKAAIQTEVKGLEELIELYIKSNPNYNRKEAVKAPEPKVDVHAELKHAFFLLAQSHLLNQQSDVANAVRHLEVPANTGDRSAWEKQAQAWANNFANLATKAEGNFHGVTFAALHAQI